MPESGEKTSLLKGKTMLAVVEAGQALRSFPPHPDQSKPSWMRSAGRFFGLTFAQTKKLYYGEVKTIDADTFLRMRSRLDELKKAQQKRQEILNDAAILVASIRNDRRAVVGGSGSAAVHRAGEASGGRRGASRR